MSIDPDQIEQYIGCLKTEDLSFGIEGGLLRHITSETLAGKNCKDLLDQTCIRSAGLGPLHLLRIRRSLCRYQTYCDSSQRKKDPSNEPGQTAAERFALRTAAGTEQISALQNAFASVLASTHKHGRIRIRLKQPELARIHQLDHLADHTEGCQEIPPHRWFAAARGVSDNALWIEVLCPPDEVKRALGSLATQAYIDELTRSIAKPVLDHIAKRSERLVIRTAAESLYALLSKAPIKQPVAGIATNGKQVYVKIVGGQFEHEQTQFAHSNPQGVQQWLHRREIQHAAVVRLNRNAAVASLIQSLVQSGMTVEPAREAGLMKQAKHISDSIRFAAAEVAARRFRDPLEGYADLEPDQLGLGEYLDRVDPVRLKRALEDARDVAEWERNQGIQRSPAVRGMSGVSMLTSLKDLRPGMELTGTVTNLTHFGAFIEMGLAEQGLVHLSELSDQFIRHPSEVVKPGDRVRVRIIEIDQTLRRISLSMRTQRSTQGKSPIEKRKAAMQALDKLFGK